MKVIEVKEFGDPKVMELVEKPAPAAGVGEEERQLRTSPRAGMF